MGVREEARRDLLARLSGLSQVQVVYAAARLGLADVLASGPMTTETLAEVVNANAAALRRLLWALEAAGVVRHYPVDLWTLAPGGHWLRSGIERSLRAAALHAGEIAYPAWGALLEAVRVGRPAFEVAFGSPFFSWLAERPELDDAFHSAFENLTTSDLASLLAMFSFEDETIVDVGGGTGTFLCAILTRFPQARGILVDRESACTLASDNIQKHDLGARCTTVAADFFKQVPRGDVYVLKQVLHDWDDQAAATILRRCRDAATPRGRVLVFDAIANESACGAEIRLRDLCMFVLTGGRERSEADFHEIAAAAGLHVDRIVPTASALGLDLIEMSIPDATR